MKRYMLDTNTVSLAIRRHPAVIARLVATPITSICISAITEGELRFGLARRPEANRLRVAVAEFLKRVDVLPWESSTANHYGDLRAELERKGTPLAPLDTLIAAHALDAKAKLVTNDQAFAHVLSLDREDWTAT